VAELGRDLYKRLSALGSHVTAMGRSVENSVKHYNALVGSLEGSVLPQARKFNELQVEGTAEPLPELGPIETDVREVRPGCVFINGARQASDRCPQHRCGAPIRTGRNVADEGGGPSRTETPVL
jgi:DNA anti-recombination protein RmuC